jgi:demethylmenaquinone methyltransferase/2-methoxy-6-polyprenyl-1,4-benzoquinol methylase
MVHAKRKTPAPSDREANSKADSEAHWFGFRPVAPSEKTALVREVFASVAGHYDVMNDLMSGGLHRLWKNRLVAMMRPQAGQVILDVAGGTGDIALRCHRKTAGKALISVCDINAAMLKEGRAKAVDQGILSGIQWVIGDAEILPIPSQSVDIYAITFGLRNVTHIDKALAQAVRVLKPGGRFYCLEFSPGVKPALKPLYDRYCVSVLPWLGEIVGKDRKAYQYLAESIQQFPQQAALAKRMESAGLAAVQWTNLNAGIAVIHSGWKL